MVVMQEEALLSGEGEPPVRRIRWGTAIRIIPSRFPPVDLFARVADAAEFEALYELESRTNPRLREDAGAISLVRPEDRVYGPGASYVMAPFAHVHPGGGRFNDSTFGESIGTALSKTDGQGVSLALNQCVLAGQRHRGQLEKSLF
jgi:hypothetical protein